MRSTARCKTPKRGSWLVLAALVVSQLICGCQPGRHSAHRLPQLFGESPQRRAKPPRHLSKSWTSTGSAAQQTTKRAKAKKRLRLLTFNVNYGGNVQLAMRAIHKHRADVVALQETTRAWPALARRYLWHMYPYRLFAHAPGAGGMGLLSRFPIIGTKRLPPRGGGWFDAWLYKVRTPRGDIQLLNVHLRPPLGENGRLSSIPRAYFATRTIRRLELQAHLKHIIHLPVDKRAKPCGTKRAPKAPHCLPPTIVLGDFNENRQGLALRWLRKKRRMKSALQQFDRTSPTWEWATLLWTFRDRLDHVMVSPHFRIESARVMPGAGSDHYPLLVVLR